MATFLAIIVWVVSAAWFSRYVALDMDRRGKAGWSYGLLTLVIPPLGAALWLLDRERPPIRKELRPTPGSFADVISFILLVLTFPWGLLIWMLLNRRARPNPHD